MSVVLLVAVGLAGAALVLGAALLGAVVTARAARRVRVRELALVAVVGRLGPPGDSADSASRGSAEHWRPLVDAVRAHHRARGVVLRLHGPTPTETVTGEVTDRPADLRTRLRAPVPGPVPAEVPAGSGAAGAGAVGEIVVHGARRGTDGPDTVLATVAAQVGTALAAARAARRACPADAVRTDALLTRSGFVAAAAARGDGLPPAVAVVDATTLVRVVGGTLGQEGADRVAALVAGRIAAAGSGPDALPGVVLPARLGVDTYALALAVSARGAALDAATALRARLVRPYRVDGLPFTAPVAVGVATLADATTDATADTTADAADPAELDPAGPEEAPAARAAALLARADVARLAARRDEGVRAWDPMLGERADRRVEVLRNFPAAVTDGGLSVHFQPVVSLGTGAVLGVEALARWQHPELGLLLPDEFVPVLEATGQAPALTALVLEDSLVAARGWLDAGLRLGVAVNVPVAQLEDPAFPAAVAAALDRHDVPAELLTLELTESGVSAQRAAALPVLRRLRGLGCRLSLDDFGTGQSSLAHLRGLPVDQVKIDKSFVLRMDTDPDDAALVRAIVGMGHTLGLTVVAEGVERETVRTALAAMGCDVAQGFGVSRGMSAEDLRGWLDAREAREGERGPRTLLA